jgi:hypothetical protein
VDAAVAREFGMKGGGQNAALADKHREAVARASTSTPAPAETMRGARMKTISSGPPGSAVSAVTMAESIWRP